MEDIKIFNLAKTDENLYLRKKFNIRVTFFVVYSSLPVFLFLRIENHFIFFIYFLVSYYLVLTLLQATLVYKIFNLIVYGIVLLQ